MPAFFTSQPSLPHHNILALRPPCGLTLHFVQAELYKRLLDMEELLERASAKQAWEIKDALRDRPSLLRTLRICVCNTHKNQFASRVPAADEEQASGEMGEESGPGAASRSQEKKGPQEWTLHILGDANGVEKDSQKLSDFIDKVCSLLALVSAKASVLQSFFAPCPFCSVPCTNKLSAKFDTLS